MGGVDGWAFQTAGCLHLKACIIGDCDLERLNYTGDVQYQNPRDFSMPV